MSPVRGRTILILAALIVAGLVFFVAVRGQELGPVSSAVLQSLSLIVGVYGGVVFTREGNDDAVRAAAIKSVRRVLVNYESLGRLATVITRVRSDLIDRSDSEYVRLDLVDASLSGLADYVVEQIASADIAVRDWRDLAPADVDLELAGYRQSQREQS